jgi:hypothetical protein
MIMKLSHAAALALVGWYLMVPPDHPRLDNPNDRPFAWQSSAPLRAWQIVESFDSATDCKRGAQEILDRQISAFNYWEQYKTVKERKSEAGKKVLQDFARYNNAVCIATDDPRLKGN